MIAATAWTLARKDLRLFARDRTALLLTFLLPLVLGTVFGTAMQGMSGGGDAGGGTRPRVELAVEDRDASESSRALVAALQAAPGLAVTVVADARRPVADGDHACGLVIPVGYGRGEGAPSNLLLLRDPAQALSQQLVLFALAPVLLPRQAEALGAGVMGRFLDAFEFPAAARERSEVLLRDTYTRIEEVFRELEVQGEASSGKGSSGAGASSENSTLAPSSLAGFDPLAQLPRLLGLDSEDVSGRDDARLEAHAGASHAFSSMAVMMLLFSVAGAGGALQQERTEGTLTRLQLTPAAGSAVLIGKLISIGLIALAQLVVLFAFGAVVFGVPVLAAPGTLAVISLAWVFLAVGFGLTLAVLCSSAKQVEGLSTLVILVMSAVGGAWFPREITPAWFRTVGGLTPVGWAMDAFHGVLWYGKGLLPTANLSGIGRQVLYLALGGAALLTIAFHSYRSRFARAT